MQNKNQELIESILNKDFNESIAIFDSLMASKVADKLAVMKIEVAEDLLHEVAITNVRRAQRHQRPGILNKLAKGITDYGNRIHRRSSMYRLVRFFKPKKPNKQAQKLNRKVGVNRKPTNHIPIKKG